MAVCAPPLDPKAAGCVRSDRKVSWKLSDLEVEELNPEGLLEKQTSQPENGLDML